MIYKRIVPRRISEGVRYHTWTVIVCDWSSISISLALIMQCPINSSNSNEDLKIFQEQVVLILCTVHRYAPIPSHIWNLLQAVKHISSCKVHLQRLSTGPSCLQIIRQSLMSSRLPQKVTPQKWEFANLILSVNIVKFTQTRRSCQSLSYPQRKRL